MNPGDLVRVEDVIVAMFHDEGLTNYTIGGRGDLVVVVEPNSRRASGPGGWYARVLHPIVGIIYIRKHRLEAV